MNLLVNIHLQNAEEPTSLKAAWELMELFYADKTCLSWLPERLVDWLSVICFFLQHLSYLNFENFRVFFLPTIYIIAGLRYTPLKLTSNNLLKARGFPKGTCWSTGLLLSKEVDRRIGSFLR